MIVIYSEFPKIRNRSCVLEINKNVKISIEMEEAIRMFGTNFSTIECRIRASRARKTDPQKLE